MEAPHKRLECWKKGIAIAKQIYRISGSFPKSEVYGLTSQMRRSSVSIPSNISEGAARQTRNEFIQFLHIAQGSLSELDTQLIIAVEIGFIEKAIYDSIEKELIHESKLITGLIKSLKKESVEQ